MSIILPMYEYYIKIVQYQTLYVQDHQYADMNRYRKFVRTMETNP